MTYLMSCVRVRKLRVVHVEIQRMWFSNVEAVLGKAEGEDMYWFVLGTVVAATLLSGCDVDEKTALDKGKEMVASVLRDPQSANFKDVRFVEKSKSEDARDGTLCGYVNAKNSFGGFTGMKRFVAGFRYSTKGSFTLGNVALEEGSNAREDQYGVTPFQSFYWRPLCEGRPIASSLFISSERAGLISGVSVGQTSVPLESTIPLRSKPDINANIVRRANPGEILEVRKVNEGWIQVSADPSNEEWLLPELVEWTKSNR